MRSLRTTVAAVLMAVIALALAHPDVYQPTYKSEPIPYNFNYNVNDDYKGLNFGQQETSDGKAVYGSYTVALPDGRKQKVEYTADHYNGYVAKVTYEGKAQHPQTYGKAITFKPSYGHDSHGLGHGGNGFGQGGNGLGHGGNGFGHGSNGLSQGGHGISHGGHDTGYGHSSGYGH